ncbi:copper amine oxidase N-terminal domain-containing protein [Schinkia sp. CFF1]
MKGLRRFIMLSVITGLLFISSVAFAHPGRTDSRGGHTCRTNCPKWGLEYEEYHYHNGGGSSKSARTSTSHKSTSTSTKSTYSTPKPAVKTLDVNVNGIKQYYDQPAILKDGRTLVPLRPIFESLGATIEFNSKTDMITATKGNRTVILRIGSKQATVSGNAVYLDVPSQLINNRTMVPLRFVSEAMGAAVTFDGDVNISF